MYKFKTKKSPDKKGLDIFCTKRVDKKTEVSCGVRIFEEEKAYKIMDEIKEDLKQMIEEKISKQ